MNVSNAIQIFFCEHTTQKEHPKMKVIWIHGRGGQMNPIPTALLHWFLGGSNKLDRRSPWHYSRFRQVWKCFSPTIYLLKIYYLYGRNFFGMYISHICWVQVECSSGFLSFLFIAQYVCKPGKAHNIDDLQIFPYLLCLVIFSSYIPVVSIMFPYHYIHHIVTLYCHL